MSSKPSAHTPRRDLARDIVVVGASAGGVKALSQLVAELPVTLPVAVFVVLHMPASASSSLPAILSHAGPLPATAARDGEAIRHRHIYVASPDNHLLLTADGIRVVRGPRENRQRPAADPLFRSAALAFGPRVIGIVLSGAMNDGTAGLLAIKRAGGIAMVQDPATALFAGMPESALRYVAIDWCLPVPELARKVVELATGSAATRQKGGVVVSDGMSESQKADLRFEADIAGLAPAVLDQSYRPGQVSAFTCPDCHGPLWEIQDGALLRYRCRVGHAFTAEEMLAGKTDQVEEALWMAINALEESTQLHARLAAQYGQRQQTGIARRFAERAHAFRRGAETIRRLLLSAPGDAAADDAQHEASTGTE